jgi:competence protein ComEC
VAVLSKEIPFLRIIVPFCAGIISGMLWTPGLAILAVPVFLTITGLVFSLKFNNRLTNHVYGFAIFIAFFTCGLLLLNFEKNSVSRLKSEPSIFISTLSDFPIEKENTFMITIKLNSIISGNVKKKINGSILLYHRKDSVIRKMVPGDIIVIKCRPLEIVNRGNPCEFDYKSFMASKGIRYYAFTGKQNILSHSVPSHRKLVHTALICREKIINIYRERGVTEERLPLVSAITLGQKNLLDPEIKQTFINAGIMHIMAVSGLHAVILSLFIFNVLFFLRRRLIILRLIITLLILWAFAFITGLTPSVLRATLMFTFLQAGSLLTRRVNGINSVLASAFILLVQEPSVLTDAGFLLSYAAVIYIIGFYHGFYTKINFSGWLPDKIWQSVVVTIVAQAGTLPLTILLFNRFPVYFIITNVIIVPLSNLLIILGCLVPLTYYIVPVSEFLASLLDKLTRLIEVLTGYAASLPYATIDRIGITTVECVFFSLTLSLILLFITGKRQLSIKYPIAVMILLVLALNIKKIKNGKSYELIVYNNSLLPTTGIRTGNTLHVLSFSDSVPPEVIKHAASRDLNIKLIKNNHCPVLIKTRDCNIMVTDSLRTRWLKENNTDLLVLTGKRPWIEKDLSPRDLPQTIIISSETAAGFRLPFTEKAMTNKIIWNVKKSGAFKRSI